MLHSIQDVVMTLSNDVRFHGVAVTTVVNAITNVMNDNNVHFIVGADDIIFDDIDWLIMDEYHFVINGKHVVVGTPFYVGANNELHVLNKHVTICSDAKRIVCVNHIAGMDTIYRD